jgi:tripartite-type tricarboxylate transporter receptor subunit TctC
MLYMIKSSSRNLLRACPGLSVLFRRRISLLGSMIVAGAIAASPLHHARSQVTPTLRVVTPAPPGGANDLIARLMGEQIGRAQGLAVVIENRPGAGTVIGTEAVARSAPDGSTLLITSPPFVINPHLRRVNYDPQTSFEPICTLAVTPTMIVVSSGSTYRTLSDLLDEARAKPGEVTMASIGPGTGSHIAFEMLVRLANIKMTFVPYPGTAPAVGAALQAPELKPKLAVQGFYPVGICGVESGAHIRRKFEEYGSVIRDANIRAAQ